ncbi:MAG: ABC transporter ATP-binding protein [Geobacteraceae bacterium]|nr:ABC transporter ATP-binding protein [Geobacteraceae bacterium]
MHHNIRRSLSVFSIPSIAGWRNAHENCTNHADRLQSAQRTFSPTKYQGDSAIKQLVLLYPYLRALRWRYVAGGCLLLATNGFALLIPWYMKLAVEGLQSPATARFSPAECALLIAMLAAMHCVTRVFSRTLVLNAARTVEFRIREDLFRKLMQLDLHYFSNSRTGDILSRFSNDLGNVRMLTGFGAMSAMNTLIIYVAAVTLMLRIHPWLTVCALAPFPVMVLVVKKVSHRLFQRSLEAQEELARLSSLAEESVSAVRLIKSYCREGLFQEQFGQVAGRYLHHNLRLARLRGLIIPVMAAATGTGTLVVLFMGGRLVIAGSITLGDFVAFSGYLAMLVWPTAVMGWILTLAQRGAASMTRLATILTAEQGVADAPDAEPLEDVREGIELRGLCFNYGNTRIIDGISFRIASGEKVGITGTVGSGKSTLVRLLPRLLPVADGMLFIDGRDINRITLASLRRLIGYIPQEAFLFSRTIRENIAYGLLEHDESRIVEAARQAGFAEDIAQFREGLDTAVGEKGVTLSGGQKQRLAIARALVTAPRVLLLDDPLSAVDAGREEEILEELKRFSMDRTVVIVSQRISAFRDCDRVIVLEKGMIAEEGRPCDLLKRGGIYTEMDRMQRMQEELG